LQSYREELTYDQVGNILEMRHLRGPSNSASWSRRYLYADDSNRLLATSIPGDPNGAYSAEYGYADNDGGLHGSMTSMPHLAAMEWDYADRLKHTLKSNGSAQDTYFTYDSSGQRVRKVYAHNGILEERIYLGGYEIFRRHTSGSISATPEEERQTLHLTDDQRRIAMVETKTRDAGAAVPSPTSRWRFQLDNHLGSACLEVDQAGNVISYEEYHPYGSTAFHTADGNAEVSAKRYRYTGKEKDDETGLYYHGARYYAPWLGRWTAADPIGMRDGVNVYSYVANNPCRLVDRAGLEGSEPQKEEPPAVDLPKVAPESAVVLGRDSKGNLVYGLGDPGRQEQRNAEEPVIEVVVRGTRPKRPPKPDVEKKPEPPPDEDRGFFDRGGGILVAGGVSLGIGLLILSGPVGWAGGLVAAMAIAGGVFGTTAGGAQLALSYTDQTTSKQDVEFNKAAGTTLSLASPGSLLGGTIGVATTGTEEGLHTGALVGGLTEGAISLGVGLSRLRPGPGVFPEPTGEVSEAVFSQFTHAQRKAYEVGQLTLRDAAYAELSALSPLERGRVLLQEGFVLKTNPLNLTKTWSTGFTPGASLIGVPLLNAGNRLTLNPMLYMFSNFPESQQ
jgi:RHS repeat-associated protein